jgi:hypothetical protein
MKEAISFKKTSLANEAFERVFYIDGKKYGLILKNSNGMWNVKNYPETSAKSMKEAVRNWSAFIVKNGVTRDYK